MVRIKTLLDLLAYGAALLGYLPLLGHLDTPAHFVFPVALLLGALGDRRGHLPLNAAFTTVLTLAVFFFYALQVGRDHLVEPAVNFLVVLLAVRLLGGKSGREYLQIFILALFALAASSLLDLSIAFLFYLVPMIFTVSTGLVLLAYYGTDSGAVFSRREVRRVGGVALALPLLSLGLMLLFFFILPRARQPLWYFLEKPAMASALSDRVVPGAATVGEGEGPPVFRVEAPPLPPEQLYWRGIVLNRLDEGAWIRAEAPEERVRVLGGTPVRQVFFPEPRPEVFLPVLDLPLDISGIRHRQAPDRVFTAPRSDRQGNYTAISVAGGRMAVNGPVDRDFYLQIPADIAPRIAAAAARIAGGEGGDRERIARLEEFFRTLSLSYSREGGGSAADPVDHFLFVSRRGYCEHFATSFTLLLRLSGVPARLVGGYYGGHYNELGGYYLVTEDSAHLWVEALVDGREWVRLDPTRLARGSASPPPRDMGMMRGLLDAVEYFWNRMVIAYDLERQMEMARRAGEEIGTWRPGLPSSGTLLWCAAGILLALLGWRLRRQGTSREERLLRLYLKRVRDRYGMSSVPPLGLEELASAVKDPACREFAEIFGQAVYRDRSLTEEEYRRLRQIIGTISREEQGGNARKRKIRPAPERFFPGGGDRGGDGGAPKV